MIEIIQGASGPVLRMMRTSPSAYLDTCGLREIAETPALFARFTQLLREKHGTLVLSHHSVGELAGQDPRHAHAVGKLVDAVAPQLYFLRAEPSQVFLEEIEVGKGTRRDSPDGDIQSAMNIARVIQASGGQCGWGTPYHTIELVERVENLSQKCRAYGLRAVADMVALYKQLEQKEPHYLHARRRRKQPRWATKALVRTLLRSYASNPKQTPRSNDGIDFMHAVVPSAYCNFVVLDGPWSQRVQQATNMIRNALITEAQVAQAFGSKPSELVRFLDALEAFNVTSLPRP